MRGKGKILSLVLTGWEWEQMGILVICKKASGLSYLQLVEPSISFSPSIPFVYCKVILRPPRGHSMLGWGEYCRHQNMLENDTCHFSRSVNAHVKVWELEGSTGNLL